ncbi:MAG: LacI family DNA-binding transcriptional regulator, partial [Albidovulum sp.]|nr:LacI family DNA-binding transcriptional regulator [Albidovulum sp.]
MSSKAVTIEEVARRSGVSSKTVSRVLNREPVVRPETREKVALAIKELGYRPHPGARIMRGRRSGIIGLITSAISDAGEPASESGLSSIHIARGVQQVCREKGFTLMIADSKGKTDEIRQLTEIFENHRVEGIIFTADHHKQVEFNLPSCTR